MPSANVVWNKGLQFVGTSESGHAVVTDAKKEAGGFGAAPTPIELTLIALGGCTAMDVVPIMKKKRQQFDDFEVEIVAEKSAQPPNYLTKIEMVYRVWGEEVSEEALVRSIELSKDKYCTVSNTLKGKAEITYRYEINPPRGE
jgi:putative redox protein